jgi:hypothetical protein
MPDVAALMKNATAALFPLLRAGLSSFLRTIALGALLTFVAMGVAGAIGSRNGEWLARVVAALITGICGGTATLVVASHLAVFSVAQAALDKTQLGSWFFSIVFERLLGVSKDEHSKENLGAVGVALETRIPLAQAQARLNRVVSTLTREASTPSGMRGWLFGRVRTFLFNRVEQLTLARFRREEQSKGAVDLLLVRDELAGTLDGLLTDQVKGLSTRTVVLFGGLAVLVASLSTYAIHRFW